MTQLTEKAEREVSHVYHMVFDLIVKLEITLIKEQQDRLIELLLQEIARSPEDQSTVFMRAVINYTRLQQGD